MCTASSFSVFGDRLLISPKSMLNIAKVFLMNIHQEFPVKRRKKEIVCLMQSKN